MIAYRLTLFSEDEFNGVTVQVLHCSVEAAAVAVTIARCTTWATASVQRSCIAIAYGETIIGGESNMRR